MLGSEAWEIGQGPNPTLTDEEREMTLAVQRGQRQRLESTLSISNQPLDVRSSPLNLAEARLLVPPSTPEAATEADLDQSCSELDQSIQARRVTYLSGVSLSPSAASPLTPLPPVISPLPLRVITGGQRGLVPSSKSLPSLHRASLQGGHDSPSNKAMNRQLGRDYAQAQALAGLNPQLSIKPFLMGARSPPEEAARQVVARGSPTTWPAKRVPRRTPAASPGMSASVVHSTLLMHQHPTRKGKLQHSTDHTPHSALPASTSLHLLYTQSVENAHAYARSGSAVACASFETSNHLTTHVMNTLATSRFLPGHLFGGALGPPRQQPSPPDTPLRSLGGPGHRFEQLAPGVQQHRPGQGACPSPAWLRIGAQPSDAPSPMRSGGRVRRKKRSLSEQRPRDAGPGSQTAMAAVMPIGRGVSSSTTRPPVHPHSSHTRTPRVSVEGR